MPMVRSFFLQGLPAILVAWICFGSIACNQPAERPDSDSWPDSVFIPRDALGPFVLDSTSFDSLSSIDSAYAPYRDLAYRFYSRRNWVFAWMNDKGCREHAGFLLNFMETARLEGIPDTFPYLEFLSNSIAACSISDSLVPDPLFEVRMTIAFFWYADKAWRGLPEEKSRAMGWFLPRLYTNQLEWLDSALTRKPAGELLSTAVFSQYYVLRNYLVRYDSLQRTTPWKELEFPQESMQWEGAGKAVSDLERSLFLHGDMDRDRSTKIMDSVLVAAIKKFQYRHGMIPDGVPDEEFYAALNVSVSVRIEQLMVNLERCRWIPSTYPSRYVVVNIPAFTAQGYKEGSVDWTMPVVVGKTMHETAIFSGKMSQVVFHPYWVIPPGILYKEIIPDILKDPAYLRKNKMEVVNAKGQRVASHDIAWKKYLKGGFPYTIRQTPGPWNALGKVKFLFPNNYSIYLHDTPSRYLFKKEQRAFSHGCIRVSDPHRLADFILQPEGYAPPQIDGFFSSKKEKWISLKNPVPVFVTYLTSWVDEEGQLHFRKDIYGHDRTLLQELLGEGVQNRSGQRLIQEENTPVN
jgi:murein L,D-transpeptidase YcbB/YkuD